MHFLSVFLVFEDEGTHDDIRVSVDILGDAVVSDVGSKQKRRADVGRAEGVVSNDLNFGINSLDFFADDLNVDHFKGRVGGTFNPDHLSVLFQGLDDVVSISDVHEVSLHALIFSQESPHVSLSSSINIVANDDVVPAFEGMKESSCGSAVTSINGQLGLYISLVLTRPTV